jgi:ABC-2 type transport system ATP-binding protein
LAERLELDLARPIKNLSKGNKQKVGLVQALMHKPELLLLDEPTSGLDPLMQQQVEALLHDAAAEGTTIFFSSHVLSEVEAIAVRVGIIRQGEIVEVARPEELTSRALRHVTVRFHHPVDISVLARLTNVRMLPGPDKVTATMQVQGDMDRLIKALGEFPVADLETERPSLEEAFLEFYQGQHKEEVA